jgi:transcriptional regulator with XRE-family HTH domain
MKVSPVDERRGERLAAAMRRAGVDNAAVAKHMGKSVRTVARWISGDAEPTLTEFAALMVHLVASADEVLLNVPSRPIGGAMLDAIFRGQDLASTDQPPRY